MKNALMQLNSTIFYVFTSYIFYIFVEPLVGGNSKIASLFCYDFFFLTVEGCTHILFFHLGTVLFLSLYLWILMFRPRPPYTKRLHFW